MITTINIKRHGDWRGPFWTEQEGAHVVLRGQNSKTAVFKLNPFQLLLSCKIVEESADDVVISIKIHNYF